MIRDVLRIIGVSCILSGGILYFTNNEQPKDVQATQKLQSEISRLQTDLETTKKQLAIAQTLSSAEEIDKSKLDNYKTEETTDKTVIKAILMIEPGSNSTIVAASLERLSIIEDVHAFNTYLSDHKLAGKIQVGEHEVNSSMDFQTLAQIITTVK